jgi:hypothetical protein
MVEWRYSSTILDFCTIEVSDQLHVPTVLPPGKEPPVPLDRIKIMIIKEAFLLSYMSNIVKWCQEK